MNVPATLRIDAELESDRICARLRDHLEHSLARRGYVLGISGGVDSAVCAALAVRAVGAERVLGLVMPERDSEAASAALAMGVAAQLGLATLTEDIGDTLAAAGCYRLRDDAIRTHVPEYDAGWKCKLVAMPGPRLTVSQLMVRAPTGETRIVRLSSAAYLQIVAATNMKQRVRKMVEYYHADRLHFAVLGTANRLELDQGFFVKGGDGLADVKPLAHLFKSEVYQLAAHLDIPAAIAARVPTSDTYPLEQTQEEFFFAMPLEVLDLVVYGLDRHLSTSEIAALIGFDETRAEQAVRVVRQKRDSTRYLHIPSLSCAPGRNRPAGRSDRVG
jgi:NAD+ synthase